MVRDDGTRVSVEQQAQHERLINQLQESQEKIQRLNDEMAVLVDNQQNMTQNDYQTLWESNAMLQQRVDELAQEKDIANAKVVSFEEIVKELRSEMRSMKKEMSELKTSVKRLE